MNADDASSNAFCHPFSPGGVARFALLRFRGIVLYLAGFALIGTAALFLLLQQALLLHVSHAIESMPASGRLENGLLQWPIASRVKLIQNPFLEISALPSGVGVKDESSADLQLSLYPDAARVQSLFGYVRVGYPRSLDFELNRTELKPAWGAWELALLIGVGAALFAGLVLSWLTLAVVYSVPIRLLGLLRRPDFTWREAFAVGVGCLMPGALVAVAALLLYASRAINLPAFLSLMILHLLTGWFFLLTAIPLLPAVKPQKVKKKNPFVKKRTNPFGGRKG